MLKELNDKLQRIRLLRAPKRKFAFRSSTPATSSAKGISFAAISSSDSDTSLKYKSTIPANSVDGNRNNTNYNELSSQSLLYYNCFSDPLPNSHIFQAGKPISLSSLSRCVLYLPLASLSLTAKDIQNSLLICGPIKGATHITAATNTTMAVSTGQLRMHNCYDCVVYLQCSSRPIIEHCSNIRFFPIPELLVRGYQFDIW